MMRIHTMAANYLDCMADFPPDLTGEHLDAPDGQKLALLEGLHNLYDAIRGVYRYFIELPVDAQSAAEWQDDEACWKAIEDPVKLLWALGIAGRLDDGGGQITCTRLDLDAVSRGHGVKHVKEALSVLVALGFQGALFDSAGQPASSFRKFDALAVSAPVGEEALLPALVYYAARFPVVRNGLPFELFLRADFRSLMPGYHVEQPHIPLEKSEITRTLPLQAREVWGELFDHMLQNYPKYRPFYRSSRLRYRAWSVDFSVDGRDYGVWSLYSDEQGVRCRIVLKGKAYRALLENMDLLSPRFQELFLKSVSCKDCVRCGKHFFYQHEDHTHRLCKGPWFYSPLLTKEDLPDLQRLVDYHITHLK